MPKEEKFHGWTAERWREDFKTDHTQRSLIAQDLHSRPLNNPFETPIPKDLNYDAVDGLVTDLVMASIDWTHDPTSEDSRASVRAVIVKLAQEAGLIT